MVRGDVAGFEMDLGDTLIVAGDEPVEDLREPDARAAVDPAHDAEVDRGDPVAGQCEQVALVHVGVEEPIGDRLAQERADERVGKAGKVVAGRDERRAVGQLDAVDPLNRHDLVGRARPVDRGDDEIGLCGHAFREFGGRGCFAAEVEFAQRPALERLDREAGAQAHRLGAERLELRRGPAVRVDRAGEIVLDAGAEDLDRDVATIGGDGSVDLRDRRCADRNRFDAREQRLERLAEARQHRRLDRLVGDGGELVLEPQQIVRSVFTDEIGASGERLAELDRRWSDRLERIGVARHCGHARAEPGYSGEAADGGWRVRVTLDPAQCSVPSEDAAPFQESPDVRCGRGHSAGAP